MIPCQRELFDIPQDVVYLNCAYTSPLPKAVEQAGQAALALQRTPWRLSPECYFASLEGARSAFAGLLGADADGVAVTTSASYGLAVAARNLPLAPGKAVLVLADQFPSNVYPWRRLAKGALKTVPRPAEGTWSEAVVAAIGQDVGIVALPHCHWVDGTVFDLAAVRTACDAVGAHLVVDGTQSVGAVPFDLAAIRPDFLAVAGHKWLFAPYSVGFLYVAERWREGEPLEENWLNREGSEEFSRLTEYRDAYRPGARRYDVGEASNFTLMPMAEAALKMVAGWGVENIAATLSPLIRRIATAGQAFGMKVTPLAERAPHMVGLSMPPRGKATDLAATLAKERVYASARGATLRVAPHLYVSDEDMDRFLGMLARGLST